MAGFGTYNSSHGRRAVFPDLGFQCQVRSTLLPFKAKPYGLHPEYSELRVLMNCNSD